MRSILTLVLTANAFAAAVSEPKIVPFELSNNFHAADARVLRAEKELSDAQADRSAATVAIIEFCGNDSKPMPDARDSRRFVCVTKQPAK